MPDENKETDDDRYSHGAIVISEANQAYARRFALLLEYNRLHALPDLLIQIEQEQERPSAPAGGLLGVALQETGIGMRTLNAMEKEFGALYVGDLLQIKARLLLKIREVGPTAIDDIIYCLIRFADQQIRILQAGEL